MFSIFLLKQVKYFLADKNTCVILCEFLNKVYYYLKNYYYYYYYSFIYLFIYLSLIGHM